MQPTVVNLDNRRLTLIEPDPPSVEPPPAGALIAQLLAVLDARLHNRPTQQIDPLRNIW